MRNTMSRFCAPCLFALALLPAVALIGTSGRAWAQASPDNQGSQDSDDAVATSALKKAALVMNAQGIAPIKPTTFTFKVELHGEGLGQKAAQDDYEQHLAAVQAALKTAGFQPDNASSAVVMRQTAEDTYEVITNEKEDAPGSMFRFVGQLSFDAVSAARARVAFAAIRATGTSGEATLTYGVVDWEAARRAALRIALEQARQRVQILGEAAKPKEFDLIFLKEGDFVVADVATRAAFQGADTLQTRNTIDVQANVTLFYGFKPIPPAVPSNIAALPKAGAAKAAKAAKKP